MSDYMMRLERSNCFEKNFLYLFYVNANENPNDLLGFYGLQSRIGRKIQGEMQQFWASEVPISILNPLPSKDFHFRMDPLYNIQDSSRGYLLVSVTGFIISREGARRNFSHSLVLAPQNNSRYYIMNDIFIVDNEVPAPAARRRISGIGEVHLKWDIEKCRLPASCPPHMLWGKINSKLGSMGYRLKSGVAMGNTDLVFGVNKADTVMALRNSGFTIEDLSPAAKAGKGRLVDFYMNSAIFGWPHICKEGEFLLAVTTTPEFAGIITEVQQMNFQILLSYNDQATEELISSAFASFKWEDIFDAEVGDVPKL